ncbi:hypothetical protein SAICODRAFT_98967 [Saitoella complicata NRRL Y-17804]|uniref:uncharacterized protein n=1 Tax=Saitoella complicata (strain BCRC 22490 / CBS 7301 / JCM 7358 / NBRC 10748 / NRRL Y-17804) TaxID=698492 RepID=UPI000866CA11|nr:uncharacterized protein SAICODRAFT_98967 [Saitoella complicata NRRL Y-17804]ODQ55959.1 hypothetical protein SAICODRAFT_98967 [Saitoella complicata NRRL Y-17804]
MWTWRLCEDARSRMILTGEVWRCRAGAAWEYDMLYMVYCIWYIVYGMLETPKS